MTDSKHDNKMIWGYVIFELENKKQEFAGIQIVPKQRNGAIVPVSVRNVKGSDIDECYGIANELIDALKYNLSRPVRFSKLVEFVSERYDLLLTAAKDQYTNKKVASDKS